MKATVKIEKQVEIKTLHVEAHVRYWEDATINGISDETGDLTPCKEGHLWKPVIDIDTGIIINWRVGAIADIHFKVCDVGSYFLKDEAGNVVAAIEDDYVPSILCPEGDGFGDYIIMKVDAGGKIEKWQPLIEDFFKD
ncbi:MAG TPA: hypothetical protein VD996_02530 [Chitinophagaceae bacterium]|nr:hypothetical protein [Chitinophagaceae bacterium]